MALSMDEQRMLAEIERRLAAEDPGLASCLTTFRRPSPATVLRSPRARIIGSLFTVVLVAMVSLMVYAMIPFRAHTPRSSITPATAGGYEMSSASTLPGLRETSDGTSASATASAKSSSQASASASSAVHSPGTATAKAQQTKTKQKSAGDSPSANP